MEEWKKYKVGQPSQTNFHPDNCRPFSIVGHVSHVDSGIEILRSGTIRKGLIFDKSILNKDRILVTWCSPNSWGPGYRYGNVRFDFDFRKFVNGKNLYWVEAIAYGIDACRILITDKDRSDELEVYDPSKGDGPWWYDKKNNKDYFNNNYCLEFMLERDISLEELTSIYFVKHHPVYCAVHRYSPKDCKDLGRQDDSGGAMLLTKMAARALDLSQYAGHFLEGGKLKIQYSGAIDYMLFSIINDAKYSGTIESTNVQAQPLARAVLNAIAIDQKEEALELVTLFKSEKSFLKAVARVTAEVLCVDEWEPIFKRFSM